MHLGTNSVTYGTSEMSSLTFLTVLKLAMKNDGMEGMRWLESGNDPEFIIVDLNMPNLNGKEFIKIIRSSNLYCDLPIVILSGTDESKERIECLNLGADDFMLKPFNPMEVLAKIKAILRRVKPQQILQ